MSTTLAKLLAYKSASGHRIEVDEFGHLEASFLSPTLSLPRARQIVGPAQAFLDGRGLTFTIEGLDALCRAIFTGQCAGDVLLAVDVIFILHSAEAAPGASP